jgi:hypothetical protein
MPPADLDPTSRQFLETLYARTGDDTQAQASMYDLGAAIGLDREQSAFTAEDLMAEGLLEIRTLSGGVALSPDGQALFAAADAPETSADSHLGSNSPMDARQRELVEQALARLKTDLPEQSISYEDLTEIMADVRTIEAQLTSPRAKTTVVRTCLEGLRDAAAAASPPWRRQLEILLG